MSGLLRVRTEKEHTMSALRKMTNFLGYSEPVENAYEGSYQAEAAYDDDE